MKKFLSFLIGFPAWGGVGGQSSLLSFNPEPDPFYSASNMAVLQQSIRDADEGRLTAHELIDA